MGIFINGNISQIVTSPAVLCLNELDRVEFHNTSELKLDIMYFEPTCFERYVTFENIQAWKDSLHDDVWFFRPFFKRDDLFIGACAVNRYMVNRVSQLIALTDTELTEQKDQNWPCRSRSYFIELLLLANSIYDQDDAQEKTCFGKLTDEIKEVVDWLHIHYLEKITIETVTKQFHTNKTTLNQKFKAILGVTVTEYINNIRIQMACSFLRKTHLPMIEIMERAGYRDDAHFLRSFKKSVGCPPSEYRNRFETS
jgi:AraC family L-rhamnose operon regulatory protein RhaS